MRSGGGAAIGVAAAVGWDAGGAREARRNRRWSAVDGGGKLAMSGGFHLEALVIGKCRMLSRGRALAE